MPPCRRVGVNLQFIRTRVVAWPPETEGRPQRDRGWPRAYGLPTLSEEPLILTEVGRARCAMADRKCMSRAVYLISRKLHFYSLRWSIHLFCKLKKLFTTLIAFSQQLPKCKSSFVKSIILLCLSFYYIYIILLYLSTKDLTYIILLYILRLLMAIN